MLIQRLQVRSLKKKFKNKLDEGIDTASSLLYEWTKTGVINKKEFYALIDELCQDAKSKKEE